MVISLHFCFYFFLIVCLIFFFFFFNDTATTEIYTLSLHDALPIHGYCLGAGLEIALMGDIRIAADDARFALPEPRVGVSMDAGGDLRLLAEIGPGWTRLLAFTGRRIDAETALRIGIVQEVVPKEKLLAHVRKLADEIAANAPLAVQGIKRSINYRAEQGLAEALRFEAASAAPMFVPDVMAQG